MTTLFDSTELPTEGSPSSRAVSRANPFQVRDAVEELVTSVSCGRRCSGSFARLLPDGSWAKTCEGSLASILDELSEPFCQTWPVWGTAWDGLATALTKPAQRRTEGTGCSSSATWGTPRTSDAMGGERPTKINANGRLVRIGSDGETEHGINVSDQAANWPTPDSVPDAPNTGSNSKNVVPGLGNRAQGWPTPGVHTSPDSSPGAQRKSDLRIEGANWPTPQTADGERMSETMVRGNPTLQGASGTFPQAQATSTDGRTSLNRISALLPPSAGKRRLNWKFVQALMGFPDGWL